MLKVLDSCDNRAGQGHNQGSPEHVFAQHFGFDLVPLTEAQRVSAETALDDEPDQYVLVLFRVKDAAILRKILHILPITVVVAWGLPEDVMRGLYSLHVHIYAGLPNVTREEFIAQTGESVDKQKREEDRRFSSQLAQLESQLHTYVQREQISG